MQGFVWKWFKQSSFTNLFHLKEPTVHVSVLSCLSLKLIKLILSVEEMRRLEQTKSNVLSEYSEVFEGLGTSPGTHKTQLKPDAVPVINPLPPPTHLATQNPSSTQRQARKWIKESGRSWGHSQSKRTNLLGELHCTPPEKQRAGALRVYVDSRDLNRAIMREHYPLPTLEDLNLLLPNAKYFSVLDATTDYWHIKLDGESSLLTTFNTPCVWTVLPYQNALRNTLSPGGIPETMDVTFEGIHH